MEIVLQIILLIVGFVLLSKGADWLVSGASSAASNFKISKQIIGMTIVAFGTVTPELAVSITSIISGNPDIMIGNVVGSIILNILLLIGLAATIRPIPIKKVTISKEVPLLFLTACAFVVLFLDSIMTESQINTFSRSDAIVCLLLFAIFIYYIFSIIKKDRKSKKVVEKPKYKLGKSLLFVLIGLVSIIGGSQFVVNSASEIAATIGISDRIIALTIVAFGTSLPELFTAITASRRNEGELLVGNIIGSNTFNICVVLSIPVAIFGSISLANFDMVDIISMLGAIVALWLIAKRGSHGKDGKILRWEGALMLLMFAAYYTYIIYGAFA